MKITIEKRIIACLLAVVLSLIAVVGVNADDGYMDDYTYVAYDSYGLIYLSKHPLAWFPNCQSRSNTSQDYNSTFILVSDHVSDDPTSVVYILKPVIGTDSVTSYQVDFSSSLYNTCYSVVSDSFDSAGSSSYYLSGSSSTYTTTPFEIKFSVTSKLSELNSHYRVTSNYVPYRTLIGTSYPTYGFSDEVFVTDPDLTIDSLIPGGDTKTIIVAISAAIDSMTNTIINVGSDYIQFIPSQAASDLESSVSSIKSSESALTGKSTSLMESVSDQWSENKSGAKSFLTTIKPSAVEFKNIYTTLTAQIPADVRALMYVIPILLFIGLILGRVK